MRARIGLVFCRVITAKEATATKILTLDHSTAVSLRNAGRMRAAVNSCRAAAVYHSFPAGVRCMDAPALLVMLYVTYVGELTVPPLAVRSDGGVNVQKYDVEL